MEKAVVQEKYCPTCEKSLEEKDYFTGKCSYCNEPLYSNYNLVNLYGSKLLFPPSKFKKGKPKFKYWKLFCMNPTDVFKYVKKQIQYGKHIQDSVNYMYITGDIPILLVAHVDTVHKPPQKVEHDSEENVLWCETGLGADDRAGVAAILEIVNRGYRPHILLCNGEESGGIGAKLAATDIKPNVNCVVELDRRGAKDSVFYDCDNVKFEEYINSFGFNTTFGSFSDISLLCPRWKIAGVNLSIGYYSAHSIYEHLKIDEWRDTVDKTIEILKNPPTEIFEYVKKCHYSYYRNFDYYSCNYDDYGDYGDYDYTDLSLKIDDIKASISIDELIILFGGNENEWVKYLLENESYIKRKLEDKLYEVLDEITSTVPPKFIY